MSSKYKQSASQNQPRGRVEDGPHFRRRSVVQERSCPRGKCQTYSIIYRGEDRDTWMSYRMTNISSACLVIILWYISHISFTVKPELDVYALLTYMQACMPESWGNRCPHGVDMRIHFVFVYQGSNLPVFQPPASIMSMEHEAMIIDENISRNVESEKDSVRRHTSPAGVSQTNKHSLRKISDVRFAHFAFYSLPKNQGRPWN